MSDETPTSGSTATGRASDGPGLRAGPHATPPDETPFPTPDVTILDDEGVRRLLAPVMRNNAKVWAYASAAPEPGATPSDEVLLTETKGRDLSVVWVRHPGSFSGATGHLLGGTDGRRVSLLRCWADLVFELADLVEARADRMPPAGWPVQFAYLLSHHLRWTASYGLAYILSGLARDEIRDAVREQLDGGFAYDLGDLPADGAAQIAAGAGRGPTILIPPGWDLDGWDPARPRTHPILSGLRPGAVAPTREGEQEDSP